MIHLVHPLRLLWFLPWAALCVWVLRKQLTALSWLSVHTAPRGLSVLTRSTRLGLGLRLGVVCAVGGLLALGLAEPYTIKAGERRSEAPTVVLIVDASLSMGASDAVRLSGDENPVKRIDLATEFARELVAAMPDETAWGVVSFSGEAVIHAPPTNDDFAVATLLNNLGMHIYSQTSGSRFSAAFEAVVHMVQQAPGGIQAVLLSDGELSHEDDYDDSLEALATLEVPVHTVGFGSRAPMNMSVWVLEDVIAGLDEKRTAAKYTTRRESRELERMARISGGRALVVEHGEWVDDLLGTLQESPATQRKIAGLQRVDLSRWLLVPALLCFLALSVGLPDRRHMSRGVLLFIAVACCGGCGHPVLRAQRLNERGLAQLAEGELDSAGRSFETAAAFGIRSHIPLYNLGLVDQAKGDLQGAHRSYERALQVQPRLAEAHYNDGHVLYEWGAQELDMEHCEFVRTRKMWREALHRFEDAGGRAGWDDLRRQARANAEFIRARLAELDELEERCEPPPPPPEGHGGGGGEDHSSGGTKSDESDNGGDGPAPLSAAEQAQVAEELARIHAVSAAAGGFHQSRAEQLDPEHVTGEGDGRKIWW